jgi:flagellar biosynthesis/type III secretory pathway chaperone
VQEATIPSELTQTLCALEALHQAECQVLIQLDQAALDGITEQKLALCDQLSTLSKKVPAAPSDRELLERIRRAALKNRVLAMHARDAVTTILNEVGVMTAQTTQRFGSQRPMAIQNGIRVNWSG